MLSINLHMNMESIEEIKMKEKTLDELLKELAEDASWECDPQKRENCFSISNDFNRNVRKSHCAD